MHFTCQILLPVFTFLIKQDRALLQVCIKAEKIKFQNHFSTLARHLKYSLPVINKLSYQVILTTKLHTYMKKR